MLGPRAIAWWALRRYAAAVHIEGLDNIPATGPVLLIARHYHHLLDGAVLINTLRRPVHIVVALDWTHDARARRTMERACAWAQWPVILRGPRACDAAETLAYTRRGLRHAANLLANGRVVVAFPEGYPAVDPSDTPGPPRDEDEFAPFRAGFATIARLAVRAGARDLALVPAGFRYERTGRRWNVTARFGTPLPPATPAGDVEHAVRALSR